MKKTIKIKGLEKALELVQSKASVRTLTANEVYDHLNYVQTKLDQILYKKDQVGIKVCITVKTEVAASYQGIPQSTLVELERGKTVWKLLSVSRDKGIPSDARIHNIKEFKEQIAEKLHDRMQRILID
ncbi:hypothetical protein VSVS12_04187 [Vibrio scophthalmi]|uniref:hypothetical protein n=1 Tax=Vibrio scophthalmi TaxID=45658 RepID=UPI000809262D|nr:hypothetical protein [Vibrio scophthalmi]ANS87887.1 hypothetical protein VSVS12_04187 [Vibrio scophthalmi]